MNSTGNTQRNIRSVRENLKTVIYGTSVTNTFVKTSIQTEKRKCCLLCFKDLWTLGKKHWLVNNNYSIVPGIEKRFQGFNGEKETVKKYIRAALSDRRELDIWEMQIRVHYSVWLSGSEARDIDYKIFFLSPIGLVLRACPWQSLAGPGGSIWGEPIHLTTGLSFYLCFNREWAQWNICLKITKH